MGAVCCTLCCGNKEDLVPQHAPQAIQENSRRNNQSSQRTNKVSSSHVQPAVVMSTSIPVVKDVESKSLTKEDHFTDTFYDFEVEEDEDVCPTCLEEYTDENPRIVAKCSHAYHLGCIYDWMERSNRCPICNKLMLFDE